MIALRPPKLFAAMLSALALCAVAASSASAAGTPTFTSPAASTTVSGSIPINFSLPEAALPNSVTITFTGTTTTTVTLSGAPTVGVFSIPAASPGSASGVSSVSGTPTIADGTYSVTLAYQAASDASIASATNLSVKVDSVTSPPVLTSPTAFSTWNALSLQYTLPEAPTPGSVKLTFFGLSGVRTLVLTDPAALSTQSWTLDPHDVFASPKVVSIAGGATIPDGTWDVTLSYRDSLGNPAASSTTPGVVVDTVTDTPSLTAPVNDQVSSDDGHLTVDYSLPETPFGAAVLELTGSTNYTFSLASSSGAHSATLDLNDTALSTGATQLSGSSMVATGKYTVTVKYQDFLQNPFATSVAVTGVTVARATPAVPPPSAPSADTTAPAISVTKKPKRKTTKATSKIAFNASETATYACKLDKGKFKTCSSPYKAKVKPGKHKLTIVATDTAGNASAPVIVRWNVVRK